MSRFASCFLYSAIFTCLCLLLGSPSLAQITNVTDTTSTPIEGAGHDYIKALSETVNPANGSVSLRMEMPTAKGRGITLPFSFGYDSNGYRHLKPGYYPYYGTAIWASNTGMVGQGGWVYSIPQLNVDDWTQTVGVLTGYNQGNPIYSYFNCQYDSSYVFRDGSGAVHALGLGAAWVYQSSDDQYCTGSSTAQGADPEVFATLNTSEIGGNYYRPAPVTVYEPDGTVYYFPSLAVGSQNDTTVYALPSYIEDRNGNTLTVSGTTIKDTLGRTLISYSGLGPAGQTNTVTVSGISYSVTWKSTSANFSYPSTWVGSTNGPNSSYDNCSPPPAVNDSQTVVSQISLPNSQSYKFYYGTDVTPNHAATNSYGLLSEIDYPSGGWIQYTWKLSDNANELALYPGEITQAGWTCSSDPTAYCPAPVTDGCAYQYQTPVVASRLVSFGGGSAVLKQTFTYSTTWAAPQSGNVGGTTWNTKSTNVTTTDNVSGKNALTVYNYSPITLPPVPFSNITTNQVPVESTISYYDWGVTSTAVRTVNKTWYDQFDLKSEQTVLDNGQSSKTIYCYVGNNCAPTYPSRLQEKDEYDFGATSPSRKTVTTYQSFSGTLGIIIDEPCTVVVYDGNGNRTAETDYYYDGGSSLCGTSPKPSVSAVNGLVSGTHDETNFAASSSMSRGNVTQKVQWASVGTSPTTKYAYDETGQVTSITDPCGNTNCPDVTLQSGQSHTTSYYYTDSFTGGTPSGVTNAYLTKVVDHLGHTQLFSYDFTSGQLTVSKDQNDINANRSGTVYTYNDPFYRPTEIDFPDGGITRIKYSDSAPSPSRTTCELMNGSAGAACSAASPPTGWKTTQETSDGMLHEVQTALSSDSTATYTAKTYYGTGKVYQSYNPTRCTPPQQAAVKGRGDSQPMYTTPWAA